MGNVAYLEGIPRLATAEDQAMPETADRTESLFAAAVALAPPRSGPRIWTSHAPATPLCATGSWPCSKPMTAPVT